MIDKILASLSYGELCALSKAIEREKKNRKIEKHEQE